MSWETHIDSMFASDPRGTAVFYGIPESVLERFAREEEHRLALARGVKATQRLAQQGVLKIKKP